MTDDLITCQEASTLLGCTKQYVYLLIARGKLTPQGDNQRRRRVSRTQVLAWKNRGENLQKIIDNPGGYTIPTSQEEELRLKERKLAFLQAVHERRRVAIGASFDREEAQVRELLAI